MNGYNYKYEWSIELNGILEYGWIFGSLTLNNGSSIC